MKDLIQRIINLRKEIADLKLGRNAIINEIKKKESVLEELEKLTVNQLDMFEGVAKHDTPDLSNTEGRK